MATFHSGIASTATLNGVELPTTGWDVDPTIDLAVFRNSKTDSFSVKEGTFKDCKFSIKIDHDFDANPFTTFTLTVGTILTNVKLYLQGGGSAGSGGYWSFPSAIVVGTPVSVETDGKITTTINCENSGTFSAPVA